MKCIPLSRWFLLPLMLALFTQCRPNPSATPVDPKMETPKNPVEADAKNPDPKLPPPPMNPPVEAVKKAPVVKVPELQFVTHPSLALKKIGTLTQPVQSLALHPECKAVAAGARNWELARLGADGKLAWSTRKTQVPCPANNRCSEFPRAQFLPNDNLVAMMDGDSLRMFNSRGRMLALRGGFLQAVLDFRVSRDGKVAGALYPHGLALWRTSGGLLRKQEIPGATAFDFDAGTGPGKKIVVAIGNKIVQYDLDFTNEKTLLELDGPVIDFTANQYLTGTRSYGPEKSTSPTPAANPLPPQSRVLRSMPGLPQHVLAVRSGKLVILKRQATPTVEVWELAGVTPGAEPVTAVNDRCLAIASGTDVYLLMLPLPLP